MSQEKIKCSHRDKVTKLCKISISSDGTIGVHLSRTPWDPYPWVRGVQPNSGASIAGVHDGDVVLEVNGHDILGQRISELANIVRTHWGNGGKTVDFLVWRNRIDQKIINQQSLQKYASCLQSIAQLLECPICLEVVKPPGWQCCNGHVLCNSCRGRTHKCPVCRVSLGPRGRCLLSDKLFTLLVESFPCDVKKNDNEIACHEQTLMTGSCTATSVSHPVSGMLSANPSNPKSENEHGRVFKKTIEVKLSQTKTNSTYSINDKIYHCPTGKSCAENGVTESCKLYNQWSILTHLQRHHDMPVNQYYGSYGELIPIELTDNSISGLTLKLEPSSHQSFPLENGKEFEQNLFFIVKIPLSDIEGDDYRSSVSTCSTSSSMSSSISRSSSQDSCCSYRSNSQGNVSERSPATFSGSFFRNTTSIHSNGGNPISTDVLSTAKASTDTDNKKYAIFVWYCGNDEDVQKFRTKIECLYPKLKWKGKIHPLTENWNSIKRKKEFLVVNGDTFKYFEIVIKMK